MGVDKEMMDFFVDEINDIKSKLSVVVSNLINEKMQEPKRFEECGQMIDRIYGAAATLGYNEIGEYNLALKEVCYMASKSENENGHKKVLKMVIDYLKYTEQIIEAIYDKAALSAINHKLNIEKSRAETLNKKEFFSVEQKSCAY